MNFIPKFSTIPIYNLHGGIPPHLQGKFCKLELIFLSSCKSFLCVDIFIRVLFFLRNCISEFYALDLIDNSSLMVFIINLKVEICLTVLFLLIIRSGKVVNVEFKINRSMSIRSISNSSIQFL